MVEQYNRFRIDAITLYAVPANGPHGFFVLGRSVPSDIMHDVYPYVVRIIESTLRTSNNLLERLHASFFFYILTTPGTFMKIGTFLPSAVLVGVAMIFWGLRQWVDAGWVQESPIESEPQDKKSDSKVVNTATPIAPTMHPTWRPRRRPVLPAIVTILATHTIGLLAFAMINTSWFLQNQTVRPLFASSYCAHCRTVFFRSLRGSSFWRLVSFPRPFLRLYRLTHLKQHRSRCFYNPSTSV